VHPSLRTQTCATNAIRRLLVKAGLISDPLFPPQPICEQLNQSFQPNDFSILSTESGVQNTIMARKSASHQTAILFRLRRNLRLLQEIQHKSIVNSTRTYFTL